VLLEEEWTKIITSFPHILVVLSLPMRFVFGELRLIWKRNVTYKAASRQGGLPNDKESDLSRMNRFQKRLLLRMYS
jgi:hypothetical protein